MTTMNKFKLAALLAAFSASVCFAQTQPAKSAEPQAQVLNAVVAVVNNDVITAGELFERTHSVALNLRRQKIQLPPMEQLRAQVLEQLILERAIEQRARETGIRVDDNLVNATIERIASQNKISVAELRRRLQLDGVPFNQFREEIRSQIVTQRLREREVDSAIQIPESEIDAFLADQAGFSINDTVEYNISHIAIPTSESMSTEELNEARDTAEDILDRARDGEDFGQLAATYSRASDALDGGNLGWHTLSQLPSGIAAAVRDARQEKTRIAMNVSSDGYYIVKINDQRDGVKTKLAGGPVTQTHARHILMAVTNTADEATVLSRLNTLRQRLINKQDDFATLARLHSVDGSATRGGDLGWLHPGDTVPEFESVMNTLQPGEISQPVRTQYGYHLIQVIDRREEAMDDERMRYMAQQILRQRKLAEATATWQRELRDRAYVDIRREALQ